MSTATEALPTPDEAMGARALFGFSDDDDEFDEDDDGVVVVFPPYSSQSPAGPFETPFVVVVVVVGKPFLTIRRENISSSRNSRIVAMKKQPTKHTERGNKHIKTVSGKDS